MEDSILAQIKLAISLAKEASMTRENALVITRLEEAMLWRSQDMKVLSDHARKRMEQGIGQG